ncbi:hypothetical protein DTL21_09870 [Bremerella cremea]|uniref:Cytochrome c domain-containing protein n=1 Tax=Blastopirellula marina TaxID=124 RepID=A0A2S8FVJ7_9BACT|nr:MULTISPECIES: hypothetical protein [Pirellulaceae]PQO36212.1 hypothetical protein C5Y83_09865 [Blastopirellula marina]RCS48889.1 hypothetical protein DTL21_09870 [Bremerella cremea]
MGPAYRYPLFAITAVLLSASPLLADDISAEAIFQKRILPIFQSPNPSSCTECHLSGVELKDYILPTQQATFASLLKAGLVDRENPKASKIIEFIRRSSDTPSLIQKRIREQELAAFEAWIVAAAGDPALVSTTDKAQPIGPQIPDEVIRHTRQDHVMASFVENVWTEVGRCAACHSPDRNQKQVQEHGKQVSWIHLNDPAETLKTMVDAGIIQPKTPEKSMLLTKPTLQEEHGGGQKMVVGDRTYKQFRRFIDDYAKIVEGKYQSTQDLPKADNEVSITTEIWFKIEGVPAKFDKKLLQVDLYRETDAGWSKQRVATSDRLVFGPQNLWQHSLSLTAERGSLWAKKMKDQKLPPGRYLARLYVDQTDKLQKDYTQELGETDFVGQVEFQSRWPAGYGKMTKIAFPKD